MPFTTHFPGWYSTSDCNSESGGSLRALNSNNDILDIAHYRNGSRPSSSIDLHLGYNKEALKQTMLKHEAIFRDQIHELHRVHTRQKELMEEMKKAEFIKRQVSLETSHSSFVPLQNSLQHFLEKGQPASVNTSCNWSGISHFKSSLVTLTSHDALQNEAWKKNSEFLKLERKFGNKMFDLQLPAYEYVESEEAESLEEVKVPELHQMMPINPLKRTLEIRNDSNENTSVHNITFNSGIQQNSLHSGAKAKCSVDLNEPLSPEVINYSESNDFISPVSSEKILCQKPTSDMDSDIPVLSGKTTRDDLKAYSYGPQHERNEVQKETVYDDESGKGILDLNSSPQGSSADSLSNIENIEFKQDHELSASPEHPGPVVTSQMQASHQLVPHIEMGIPASSVPPYRKRDFETVPIAVQALPCFNTSVPISKRSKGKTNLSSMPPNSSSKATVFQTNIDGEDSTVGPPLLEEVTVTKPDTRELDAIKGTDKKEGLCFKVCIDLNTCVNGDEYLTTPSVSAEIYLEAPTSPENKESNRPREDSDGNQTSPENTNGDYAEHRSSSVNKKCTPPKVEQYVNQSCEYHLLTPENKENFPTRREICENETSIMNVSCPESSCLREQQASVDAAAAETIVSISSSGHKTYQDISIFKLFKPSPIGHLDWFARIASSVIDDSESDFGFVSSGNDKHNDDDTPHELDYFEAMTLKLTDTNDKDTITPKLEAPPLVTSLPSKPRSGRSRRGRQQKKDFQSEILPSLASLSRCEVSEDLQTIGGLMEAAGTHWETTGYLRNAGRGRKRTIHTSETRVERRIIIDWGNVRRRGPRCRSSKRHSDFIKPSIV